ncbi:hypothetical protein MJO29_015227, partial [Puccinia striiformis f. sp. tritici]
YQSASLSRFLVEKSSVSSQISIIRTAHHPNSGSMLSSAGASSRDASLAFLLESTCTPTPPPVTRTIDIQLRLWCQDHFVLDCPDFFGRSAGAQVLSVNQPAFTIEIQHAGMDFVMFRRFLFDRIDECAPDGPLSDRMNVAEAAALLQWSYWAQDPTTQLLQEVEGFEGFISAASRFPVDSGLTVCLHLERPVPEAQVQMPAAPMAQIFEPLVRTVMNVRCRLWFNDHFVINQPNLPEDAPGFEILDCNEPPFLLEVWEAGMNFIIFKRQLFEHIGESATNPLALRTVLERADTAGSLKWTYIVMAPHSADVFSREANQALEFPIFIRAIEVFPPDSFVAVSLRMDRPAQEPPAEVLPQDPVVAMNQQPHVDGPVQVVPQDPVFAINQQPHMDRPAEVLPQDPVLPINQPDRPALADNNNLAVPNQPEPRHPLDLTLNQFLQLCRININNRRIQWALESNTIEHWTAFRGLSALQLERRGFGFGGSILIVQGTQEAIRRMQAR